jgi:hypothetical protein
MYVDFSGLFFSLQPATNLQPSALWSGGLAQTSKDGQQQIRTIICAIRARDKFLVCPLEGKPCFQVIFLRRREVQSARNDCHDTVRDREALVELFRGGDHRIEHLPRLFWLGNAELFDFLELMHAENAPHVTASRTSLLAETCRIARVLDRKLFFGILEPLIRMECRDRLLRCSNKVLFVIAPDDLCAQEGYRGATGNIGYAAPCRAPRQTDPVGQSSP